MIERIVQELHSKGWSLTPRLLDLEHLAQISGFFEFHKTEFNPAKVGPKNQKLRKEDVRGDYTFWLDPLNPPAPFAILIDFLNDLKQSVNSNLFLGLQEYECHLAFYPPGTFYKKHSDRHTQTSTRSLSFVFYLNEEWNEENGGELVLYDQQGETLQTVTPAPGLFICFLSDEFPHEVKAGNKERRSFTGWMHTKIVY